MLLYPQVLHLARIELRVENVYVAKVKNLLCHVRVDTLVFDLSAAIDVAIDVRIFIVGNGRRLYQHNVVGRCTAIRSRRHRLFLDFVVG